MPRSASRDAGGVEKRGRSLFPARDTFLSKRVDSRAPPLSYVGVPIVRAVRRAPSGGDSGKRLPKSGAQSPRTNQIIYLHHRARNDIRVQFTAGHNKWSKVKRIQGAIDAERGKLFSELTQAVAVTARSGLPDPGATPISNSRPKCASLLPAATDSPDQDHGRHQIP